MKVHVKKAIVKKAIVNMIIQKGTVIANKS